MLSLGKTHDPKKNPELLQQIEPLQVHKAINETEQLFQQCRKIDTLPLKTQKDSALIKDLAHRPFSRRSILLPQTKVLADANGNIYPDWKDKLDKEYNELLKHTSREVNVTDYGAVGDGKTDCTSAFKKAIGNGKVRVRIPSGVFVTKKLRLPSWTWLQGEGKGKTVIKLHSDAGKDTRLVTNSSHWMGNHHIMVDGMSLDWNVERLGNVEKTSTSGNHSSCLTFAKVTYGWVKDVEGINPGLHCFDISSTMYNYAGDGYKARGGSKYVWLENLTGYGFGDDGITTHHSDYIYIGYSHMCDPSGRAHKKGFSNSNGFEIDDGSRNVLLVNNSSARCFGGVEIKAHQNSSAANNVEIIGHLSLNDNRSFNFRHIGHHKKTDPVSKTAFHIKATHCASIAPIFSDLYAGSTPRAMVISGYKNVVINHFTSIGDPKYDFKQSPVMAVQYQARNVILNHITIRNFKNAASGIKVFGGDNHADGIVINDANAKIEVGSNVEKIEINKAPK